MYYKEASAQAPERRNLRIRLEGRGEESVKPQNGAEKRKQDKGARPDKGRDWQTPRQVKREENGRGEEEERSQRAGGRLRRPARVHWGNKG